jgi:hypothetical protein
LALVDRSHFGVVVVEGPERLSWLHALTSQSLDTLVPGVPTETLILSPQGHVEHQARLIDDGSRTFLVVEPGTSASLVQFLVRMQFLTRVEVRDESERWALLTLQGRDLEPLVAGIGDPGTRVLIPRRWPSGSLDVLVSRDEVGQIWAAYLAAGFRPVGYEAYEAMRIAAGEARLGLDTDHRTLVHEVGWLAPAVHLRKGCYRGQETVARVHNLGRPPRRLVTVHLDGSEHVLPARGSALTQDGRAVGTLTSVARHVELGPIGLAMLRQSASNDIDLVTAEEIAVSIDRDVSSPTEPVDLTRLRG